MKEESLSGKIKQYTSTTNEKTYNIETKHVKEAVKKDEELINQFACGNITLLELKQERIKIFGEKLI